MFGWTARNLRHAVESPPDPMHHVDGLLMYIRARLADLPFGGWYLSDTQQFRLIVLVRRKMNESSNT